MISKMFLLNLPLTIFKIFFQTIGNVLRNLMVYFDNNEVNFPVSGKFLGEYADRDLSSDVHISEICKKLSTSVGYS